MASRRRLYLALSVAAGSFALLALSLLVPPASSAALITPAPVQPTVLAPVGVFPPGGIVRCGPASFTGDCSAVDCVSEDSNVLLLSAAVNPPQPVTVTLTPTVEPTPSPTQEPHEFIIYYPWAYEVEQGGCSKVWYTYGDVTAPPDADPVEVVFTRPTEWEYEVIAVGGTWAAFRGGTDLGDYGPGDTFSLQVQIEVNCGYERRVFLHFYRVGVKYYGIEPPVTPTPTPPITGTGSITHTCSVVQSVEVVENEKVWAGYIAVYDVDPPGLAVSYGPYSGLPLPLHTILVTGGPVTQSMQFAYSLESAEPVEEWHRLSFQVMQAGEWVTRTELPNWGIEPVITPGDCYVLVPQVANPFNWDESIFPGFELCLMLVDPNINLPIIGDPMPFFLPILVALIAFLIHRMVRED